MTEERIPYSARHEKFRLTVPGNPIPKGRPRVVNGHAYTPQRTREYEARVRMAAALAWKQPAMTGPLAIQLTFYRENLRRADFDNLTKAIVDALQGVVLTDDNQIVHAVIWKRLDRVRPRVEIIVEEV